MLNDELKIRNLPELLTFANGEKVKNTEDWEKRREELLRDLQSELYGNLPEEPKEISFETERCEETFCAGKADLKKVNITCVLENGSYTFPVYCTIPHKKAKTTFVLINFRDSVPDRYLPAEELVDNDCAVFSFCYNDVTADNNDFSDGLAGVLFPNGRTKSDDAGKIAMWAWAAMRVMDYIQTLDFIDKERIVVIGHSRLGKTALFAGAMDKRFMSAASNDSGCCGAAIIRGKTGETLPDIYNRFGYWFCPKFKEYALENKQFSFDQHALLAAIAPRKLYIASAEEDSWADPKSEYLSCVAASEVYELYGLKGLIHENDYPKAPVALHQGEIGYHTRKGLHYFSRTDWLYYLEYYNS